MSLGPGGTNPNANIGQHADSRVISSARIRTRERETGHSDSGSLAARIAIATRAFPAGARIRTCGCRCCRAGASDQSRMRSPAAIACADVSRDGRSPFHERTRIARRRPTRRTTRVCAAERAAFESRHRPDPRPRGPARRGARAADHECPPESGARREGGSGSHRSPLALVTGAGQSRNRQYAHGPP